jgi:hypothetical protein
MSYSRSAERTAGMASTTGGYYSTNWGSFYTDRVRTGNPAMRQIKTEERAKAGQSIIAMWTQIDAQLANMRKTLTLRYQKEF